MGIVFRTLGLVSVGLLVCAACGDATEDDTNSGPPPFAGDTSMLPAQPAMPPSGNPAPSGAMDPVATPPASNEAQPTNVPVVPSTPEMDGTTPAAQTPTEPTPTEPTPTEPT